MNEPDITCVIPTYNDRINLPRAVFSALNQGDVKVEVILVDDFSNAQTREMVAAIAAADPRVRAFPMPANGGQGQARNVGAALARSRFLAFLDQDDEHALGWYRYAINHLLANPQLGALSGHAKVIDIPPRFGIDETDLRLRGLSLVFIANIVFKTRVFLATGGFPVSPLWRTRVAGEDGLYRAGLARNWRAVQCPQPALIHRAKEGGATAYFLDRSAVENDRVVMTRLEAIETNGELLRAQEAFWAKARQGAADVIASCNPSTG